MSSPLPTDAAGREPRSALERVLSLVSDVRAKEGTTATLLTLNVFALLTAYYLIKPVRDALIVSMPSGPEYKSYMGAVIAVLLVPAVALYSRVADRIPKHRLVIGVTTFFASNLVLFFAASQVEVIERQLGLVFYAWVGVFNMMAVAQFWAFANDVYDEERGRRLFPVVGVGASLGAVTGAALASDLNDRFGSPYPLLLLSAFVLLACAFLTLLVYRRERERMQARPLPEVSQKDERSGAFALVLKHRYLLLIGLFSLIFTLVNSNGEYLMGRLARDAFARETSSDAELKQALGGFYSSFYFYVNLGGVLLQTFAVSRLVKYLGFGPSFYIFPVVALADALAIMFLPVFSVARWGKTAENAVDYSLNNTLRNMLWLPTSEAMKYKAKQAVDTFFVRLGDVTSGGLVWVGSNLVPLGATAFAGVNAGLVSVWLVLAVLIVRERKRLLG